ncbi:MAG: phage BR0599 family protein [Rhodobacteraceae bacterium]|nr:phage BR0599 family protein [Paracoccaceae bacterium]
MFNTLQEASAVVGEREFYVFDFGESYSKEYYTTHHSVVTESALTGTSITWMPSPILRKGVKETHTDSPGSTQLVLPVMPSFVSLVAQGGLESVKLSIYRGFGDDYANDYQSPWWVGYLQDITVNVNTVIGNLKSIEVLFDDSFPKISHQPGCNNTLYDSVCGVDPALFTISRTVTSISGDGRVLVIDGAVPPDDYYTLGRVAKAGGSGIPRHVSQQAGPNFVLHIPIPGLVVGDSVTLTAGCLKRILEDCVGKFNNKAANVSTSLIPSTNPVIDGF